MQADLGATNLCEGQHSKLADFFADIERSFQSAIARSGEITCHYRIAGQLIRFRFAGSGLIPAITPAFAHLATPTTQTEPDLTISLCDSATTGAPMPAPLWSTSDYTMRGDIRGFDDPRYRLSFHVPSSALQMVDMARGRAFCWLSDAQQAPSDVKAKPLLHILQWWLAGYNCRPLHAGLVGHARGAALLAGGSGAGKSSTALACLASDLLYGGDDFCLVDLGASPQAHSLFCSGRLHLADLEHLPFLQPALSNPDRLDDEKALFFLHEHFAKRLAISLPLRMILLPRVCDQRDTTWEAAQPAAAREALLAGTLHLVPNVSAPAALYTITQVIRRFPCYHLNLGKDRRQIPAAIRAILAEWV